MVADPPLTRAQVVQRLVTAQKSNRGAGAYSRWINRPLGRQLAAVAYLLRLTPNQVSLLSAACSYAGIVVIATVRPSWPIAVLVMALLVLGYAMDSADGQVARLRGGGSPAGEWLDHVLDEVKIAGFHLGVGICWFRFYDLHHATVLLVPAAYLLVAGAFFFAIVLSDLLRRIARLQQGGTGVGTASVAPDEAAPVLRSLLVVGNDWGVLCLVVVLLPAHDAFITVYGVLLAANAGYLMVACARWWRELRVLTT